MKKQIEKFYELTGYQLIIKNGKPYYGGWLDLRGTAITSLPDNLTVGGWLDLRGTAIRDISKVGTKLTSDALERIDKKRNQILKWEWNDKTYIKADGIFSLVVSQHGKVYRIQQDRERKNVLPCY